MINPAGIIFGPNARVDVSGSFAASTADYLKLVDGARFVAALGADDSALSTSPVGAYGFLNSSPNSLTVNQSTLSVPDGKMISLVGGDILVDGGFLQAPRGRINVASVKSVGEVPADLLTLSVAEFAAAFPEQGQIDLRNGAQVDVSGEGGGQIVIRGGILTVDASFIQANTTGATDGQGIDIAVVHDVNLVNGGQINSISTAGLGAGGDINLTAQSILLDGKGLTDGNFNPLTQISTATGAQVTTPDGIVENTGGPGRGGNIVITAGSLELVNSAQISSASFGSGPAGRIEITADSVRLDALLTTPTQISANTLNQDGGGKAGDIILRTGNLEMRNGALLVASTLGTGDAGQIEITATSVNLFNGAIISTATFDKGNGGSIRITADSMRLDGRDTFTFLGGPNNLTGIQAVTTTDQTPAPGGDIEITTGSLQMLHMGSIFTDGFGLGPSGNIKITAGSMTLASGSSIKAAGEADGPAGGVTIHVAGDVTLTDHSDLQVSAFNNNGGDITVTAGGNIRLINSEMTAQASQNGGNINLATPAAADGTKLTGQSLVYLLKSTLTAEATAGNGGNITIDPQFVVLNLSAITANANAAGSGGNINVSSTFFFASQSPVTASSPLGPQGTVVITAPDVDLTGSVAPLSLSLLGAEAQLPEDCAVKLPGGISSFIVFGRGGLPLEPGGFLPSTP
jgi:large exoprotein involved in heme utilization and adhesion